MARRPDSPLIGTYRHRTDGPDDHGGAPGRSGTGCPRQKHGRHRHPLRWPSHRRRGPRLLRQGLRRRRHPLRGTLQAPRRGGGDAARPLAPKTGRRSEESSTRPKASSWSRDPRGNRDLPSGSAVGARKPAFAGRPAWATAGWPQPTTQPQKSSPMPGLDSENTSTPPARTPTTSPTPSPPCSST